MRRVNYIILFVFLIQGFACTDYTPKPYGYFRIEMKKPEYNYAPVDSDFSLLISSIARIQPVPGAPPNENWFDISYPSMDARIHCSYFPVDHSGFAVDAEESRKLVYKHVVKANAINEQTIMNPDRKIYAIVYDIKGNVASPIQFVVTDSTHHFFRGALYFNCVPNEDSLAPVINYLRNDIEEIISGFRWGDN